MDPPILKLFCSMSFWGVQFYDMLSATIETTTRQRSERLKLCQPQKHLALPPSFFHHSFSFGTWDKSNSNLPNLHLIITTWCQGTRTASAARFGEPSSWKYWRKSWAWEDHSFLDWIFGNHQEVYMSKFLCELPTNLQCKLMSEYGTSNLGGWVADIIRVKL